MIAMQLTALCLMATSALALPIIGENQPDAMSCPFTNAACTTKPPMEAECQPVYFGKCTKAPSSFVNFYTITDYDQDTNMVTFQRFSDSECKIKDPTWPAPSTGNPKTCIGPIASFYNIIKAYMYLELLKTYPTTSTESIKPTSTEYIKPTSTMSVEPTSTMTVQPTSTMSIEPTSTISVQPTSTISVQPTSTISAQPDAKSCPFMNSACTTKPPMEDECQPVYFGKCTKAPSIFDNFYTTTYYDQATNMITFLGFSDSECKNQVSSSLATSTGNPNICVGPIASSSLNKAYMYLEVLNTYPTTSTKSIKPTSTEYIKPTSTMSVEPTSTVSVEPTSTMSVEPTSTISVEPTSTMSVEPTSTMTVQPTSTMSVEPTSTVSVEPTSTMSVEPASTMSIKPISTMSIKPTSTISIMPDPTECYTEPDEQL